MIKPWEIDQKMKQDLRNHIIEQVEKTFYLLFNVKVRQLDDILQKYNDDDLVAKAVMHQNGLEAILRFAFPRPLLKPLLLKIYEPELARHESIFEDAACEITNIVCSSLKTYLNQNNYEFTMDIPKIDYGYDQKEGEKIHNQLNINFIITDDGFVVDLLMRSKEKTPSEKVD